MSSGVGVSDEVKDLFNTMKVVKNDDDEKEHVRLAVLWINGSQVEVEKKYTPNNLEPHEDMFKKFVNELNPKQCRYILYDCHYTNEESCIKEELVFVKWCPDTATVKEKMLYSSSEDAVKKAMTGVKHKLQVSEPGDCNNRSAFMETLNRKASTLEGQPLSGGCSGH